MGYWHSRGLRGSQLEDAINQSNRLYFDQGLAVVQKLPTAIKPVELDPQKGTIRLAYFEEKSTVDYMGNVQGIPICFDAKETNEKRLPIANIHEHQMEFMQAFDQQDGLSFLIVWFKLFDETYLLPYETLKTYWDQAKAGGRKSIPYQAFDPRYRINRSGNILVHYLEAINTYLTEKGESI